MLPFDNIARLDALLVILRWEGRLNNARIRELFHLSSIRASEWIREFRELHPQWLEWDSKSKSYFPTSCFFRETKSTQPFRRDDSESLARYIVLVGLPDTGNHAHGDQVLWSAYPDFSTPQPQIFSTLLSATQTGKVVEILYRSMGHPEPHKRTLSPHSMIRVGRRWHTRAFSDDHNEYRDFTLGRIVSAKILPNRNAEHVRSGDVAWNTLVQVRIGAHPALTPNQASVIRSEYFNDTASLTQACRGALVSYFIQDVRAAINVVNQTPPDYQLVVENIDEIQSWLFPN